MHFPGWSSKIMRFRKNLSKIQTKTLELFLAKTRCWEKEFVQFIRNHQRRQRARPGSRSRSRSWSNVLCVWLRDPGGPPHTHRSPLPRPPPPLLRLRHALRQGCRQLHCKLLLSLTPRLKLRPGSHTQYYKAISQSLFYSIFNLILTHNYMRLFRLDNWDHPNYFFIFLHQLSTDVSVGWVVMLSL